MAFFLLSLAIWPSWQVANLWAQGGRIQDVKWFLTVHDLSSIWILPASTILLLWRKEHDLRLYLCCGAQNENGMAKYGKINLSPAVGHPASHFTYNKGIPFLQDTHFTRDTGYSSYFILTERGRGQRGMVIKDKWRTWRLFSPIDI